MDDLSCIELTDLYDLLAQHTNRYLKMLSDGVTKREINQYQETIISIQSEIYSRKGQLPRSKKGRSNNSFSPDYIGQTGEWT